MLHNFDRFEGTVLFLLTYLGAIYVPIEKEFNGKYVPGFLILDPRVPQRAGVFFSGADQSCLAGSSLVVYRYPFLQRQVLLEILNGFSNSEFSNPPKRERRLNGRGLLI